MGGIFYVGEKKVRPDNYHRITTANTEETVGARGGIGAAVVTGNWGAIGKAVSVKSSEDYKKYVGDGNGYETLKQLFRGGVDTAVIVRVGTGGVESSVTLKDTTESAAKNALKLTAKYPGTFDLSVSVKTSLADETVKEITVLHGTTILESYKIPAGDSEVKEALSVLLR